MCVAVFVPPSTSRWPHTCTPEIKVNVADLQLADCILVEA